MNRICCVTCLQAVRATTSAMRQRLSVPIICSTNTGTCPQRPFLRICCHALSMTFTKQLPIIVETKTVQFRIRRLSLRCRKVRVSTWRSILDRLLFLEKKKINYKPLVFANRFSLVRVCSSCLNSSGHRDERNHS